MFPKAKGVMPRMKISDEALIGRKGHPIWLELLLFVLIFTIASTAETIPLMISMGIVIATEPGIVDGLAETVQGLIKGEVGLEEYADAISKTMQTVIEKIMLPSLFATAAMIVCALIYCNKIEKRPLSSLGFRRKDAVPEYLVGLVIGAGLFAAAIGICALSGSVTVTAVPIETVSWTVALFFVGYLIQGMSEEVVCRGYLMMSLSKRTPIGVAVALSSIIFGLLHAGNPGFGILPFINLVLFGAFAGVYFYKRGSIWGVAAIHSAWNFTQGNVFGVSVSGTGAAPAFLSTAMGEGTMNTLWNGGTFGLEGGLGVTIVLSAALLVMLLIIPAKKSELSDVVPETNETNETPTDDAR